MLQVFSGGQFYNQYVRLPPVDAPVPPIIQNNPKFYPFFKDALGAIDGTHINCSATAEMRQAARDRKGGITQNCLAICGFNMIFYYIFSGWDGSAADSTMFYDARMTDLHVPEGKYYLADAGFPICDALIIPYRGVRYHLAEWGRAQQRCTFIFFPFDVIMILYVIFAAGLPMHRSSTIYDTHRLEMLSSGSLGS
jgi:hypothetical protein